MTYQTYEFTAFTEADLLSGNDTNLGCGDTFTMPGQATTCISVTDNDSSLSGDNWCNENANDSSGQQASITGENGEELGNGGQIYAESYFWVRDNNGNWYVMIEIEQEGGSGDYFAFYNGYGYSTPEPGTELTVYSSCNVKGSWVDYNSLDAGEKEVEPGNIYGRLTIDDDGDNTEANTEGNGDWDEGVEGQTVQLVDLDGNVVAETTTDANGAYSFMVAPGDYKVKFPALDGYEFAEKGVGSWHANSDANANGLTDVITVTSGADVSNIDASIKQQTGSISGTVFCDEDCDGINGTEVIVEGCDYTIEAEHMQKYGFKTVSGAQASADCLVKLNSAGGWGDLTTEFSGKDGTYDVTIWVQDENDGQSMIKLKVNGQMVDAIRLDNDNDGGGSNNGGFSAYVIQDVELKDGDDITLWANGDGYEFVRIDKIDLEGQDTVTTTEEPTKAGVTIKLIDADTGEVVATTETDADGNYAFDGVPVGDYKIMGVAPNGTEFTIQDAGSNDNIDSDVDENGMSGVVTVTADGNVDVDLGVCEKPDLGSLSGRYFCDTDYDAQDNGNGGEPGLAGIVVELLDAAGNGLGVFTETDAQGNYSFGDLEAGTYGVKFTDPNGVIGDKTLVEANVGDDASDSDAIGDATMSVIEGIVVVEGQDTPDNDAGVEELGSLSGRYFCDENRDGLDNDGTDNGIAGIVVELLDAAGNGTGITTVTDAQGNYSFGGLVPGSYGVKFTDDSGKYLTTQNVDNNVNDDIDSDAADLGNGMSQITNISVTSGNDTPDNDAGVFPNEDPTASDDAAMTCADEEVTVDLSDNYGDVDSASVAITMLAGQNIADGQTISVDGVDSNGNAFTGLEVTRSGDEFIFNGESAFADYDIGESATASLEFKVEDSDGATATASVDVTFKGDANSVDSFMDSFPAAGTYELTYAIDEGAPFPDYAFDLTFINTGDDRFDGVTFTEAYCLDFNTAVATGVTNNGTIFGSQSAAAVDAFDPNTVSNANGLPGAENLDLINWVVSQNFEDNGSSGWAVQFAIWELADDFDASLVDYSSFQNTDLADVEAIVDAALLQDGFEFGVGDTVGMIVDPGTSDPANVQPFIVAIDWEPYDCLC